MQPTTTANGLTEAHNAIEICLNARDYHSLDMWARDATAIELHLNDDVAISNNKNESTRYIPHY